MIDVSVIIITFNEAHNLPRLLNSLPDGCEVIVVDSGSTDQTRLLAKSRGAFVAERAFDDYSSQKNYALSLATRSWVLSLDADEELDSELKQNILNVLGGKVEILGYRIRRRLVFLGHRLRFGKTTDYPLRLFQNKSGHFQGRIHERFIFDDKIKGRNNPVLAGSMWHFSYLSLHDYFDRFNRYTSQIAISHFSDQKGSPTAWQLALRIKYEFLSRYILRGGFLDGYPGFCYALLSSFYAFVKYAKLKEIYERK